MSVYDRIKASDSIEELIQIARDEESKRESRIARWRAINSEVDKLNEEKRRLDDKILMIDPVGEAQLRIGELMIKQADL
jgi:hypothetical protein